jgi:hypothetical protein
MVETFMPPEKRNPRLEKSIPEIPLKIYETSSGEEDGGREEHRNIPAILPYEAKQALLRDMRQRNQRTLTGTEKRDDVITSTTTTTTAKPEVGDNVVNVVEKNKEVPKETAEDDDEQHFFYSNSPVLEYHLTDGTRGSVKKTPRRRRK